MQYTENTKDLVSFTGNNFILWRNIGKYITANPNRKCNVPFWVQFLIAFAFADQNLPGSRYFWFVRWPFIEFKGFLFNNYLHLQYNEQIKVRKNTG